MIRQFSFMVLAVSASTAAFAQPDGRIRSVTYDPNEIVRIIGKAGIQSTIEFAADEQIENVAVGDSSVWQVTPNRRGSLIFVKPLSPRSRTNMTVVTDKRTYMFDLVAGDKFSAPLYAMKFSYPHDKFAQAATAPVQQATANAQPAQAQTQAEAATMVADKLHFDWVTKGNAKLLPGRVFDDGSSLYLSWNRETPLPAILTVSEDRKEGPLNYRMSGEYIVVTPVPQNIVLRYGNKTAALWPSRRIAPPPTRQQAPPRLAASIAPAQQQQPAQVQPAPPPSPAAVKLANVSNLFTDKLTDNRNDQ